MDKPLVATAIALALLATPAHSAEWDTTDKVLYSTFVTLQVVDGLQTHYALHHPEQFRELNPLMKSDGAIVAIKSLLVGGSYYLLKDADSQTRKAALVVLDGLYLGVTAHNASIGVRIGF